jgi:hypothetical protein
MYGVDTDERGVRVSRCWVGVPHASRVRIAVEKVCARSLLWARQ